MILIKARIVSTDPPLPADGEWADANWVRRDTWVRLHVLEGEVEPEIDLFLIGIPAEATRWAHFPWMDVPLELGREYLLELELAPLQRQRGRLRVYQPGDFQLVN